MKCFICLIFGKILDLLFLLYLYVIFDVYFVFGMSDYLVIFFYINVKVIRLLKFLYKVFDYKRVDFEGLRKIMFGFVENFFVLVL